MREYHDHSRRVDEQSPEAERVEVTRVTFKRGAGCCQESPVRLVTAYYADDGRKLAERDPHHEADHEYLAEAAP